MSILSCQLDRDRCFLYSTPEMDEDGNVKGSQMRVMELGQINTGDKAGGVPCADGIDEDIEHKQVPSPRAERVE